MSAPENREQLTLADALTKRTQALCQHLEDGVADILDLVTPTTAALLQASSSTAQVYNCHAASSSPACASIHRPQRQTSSGACDRCSLMLPTGSQGIPSCLHLLCVLS